MVLKELDVHMQKNSNNLDTDIILFSKIKSKWITDLNVKYKTIKHLKYEIGGNLNDLSLVMTF